MGTLGSEGGPGKRARSNPGTAPRLDPYRHGVSARVFSLLDDHAWWRIVGWIRAKYKGKSLMSMKELRRRFCDKGWRIAHQGVVFTGASSVAVTRYRCRGSAIPTPWTVKPAAADGS
jgi:RNA-directed DNA polymerase